MHAVVLACALAGVFPVPASSAPAAAIQLTPWTGPARPGFSLPALDGGRLVLTAQRAPVVLVHFWATWCEPCRDELPALKRLAERGGSELKVIAISVAEPASRVQRFLENTPVNFPIALDDDRAVAKSWDVSTLPTTFVLDANLQAHFHVEQDFAWDTLEPKTLKEMIASKGTAQRKANPQTQ